MCNSERFHVWTLRYSLRRVSHLDSVKCDTHNPKVGGSSPPTNAIIELRATDVFTARAKKGHYGPLPVKCN